MKIHLAPLSMRRPLRALGVAALLTGAAACGGGASSIVTPDSTPTPTASATHSTPISSTPSSAAAVKSNAPVPVERNLPGDIPDNLAFISYADKAGGYPFTHPEGWAQTGTGTRVVFTDKLNEWPSTA